MRGICLTFLLFSGFVFGFSSFDVDSLSVDSGRLRVFEGQVGFHVTTPSVGLDVSGNSLFYDSVQFDVGDALVVTSSLHLDWTMSSRYEVVVSGNLSSFSMQFPSHDAYLTVVLHLEHGSIPSSFWSSFSMLWPSGIFPQLVSGHTYLLHILQSSFQRYGMVTYDVI